MARLPRTRSTPQEEDEQTEIEVEMGSSGRSQVRPSDRLFGPYLGRFEAEASTRARDAAVVTQPPPRGSDEAPTPLALAREHERHRLERNLGRRAAGTDGRLRASTDGKADQARGPRANRKAMQAVQRKADRKVVGRPVPSRHR